MTEDKQMDHNQFPKAIVMLGLLLAIDMATAAFILGVQAKRVVSGQQSITAGDDSYGGVYDKSTIDKTARVVVTIAYNIE